MWHEVGVAPLDGEWWERLVGYTAVRIITPSTREVSLHHSYTMHSIHLWESITLRDFDLLRCRCGGQTETDADFHADTPELLTREPAPLVCPEPYVSPFLKRANDGEIHHFVSRLSRKLLSALKAVKQGGTPCVDNRTKAVRGLPENECFVFVFLSL